MTVWAGAFRPHRIAPTHGITTQPVARTPDQVINVIATPIGPNPLHPLSSIGKTADGPATTDMHRVRCKVKI